MFALKSYAEEQWDIWQQQAYTESVTPAESESML